MAFKVAGTNPRGGYALAYERESLDPIGAEIVTIRYESDEQFLSAIADLDAVIMGPGARISAAMMPGLRRVKAIVFTGVGVDRVDGRVVDEAALIRALQEGQIAAAGLNVLEGEPAAKNNPLRTMPNVVITPHVAYYSDEARVEGRRRVGQEIAAVLSGRRPRNRVNPTVLERLSLV